MTGAVAWVIWGFWLMLGGFCLGVFWQKHHPFPDRWGQPRTTKRETSPTLTLSTSNDE